MSDTYFWKKPVNFKTETAENAAVRALLIGGTALGRGEGAWPRSSGSAHCRVPGQHGKTLPIGSRSQSLPLRQRTSRFSYTQTSRNNPKKFSLLAFRDFPPRLVCDRQHCLSTVCQWSGTGSKPCPGEPQHERLPPSVTS